MLKSLLIKNYALIDNLNLELNYGFTTITGETGAGKSILLGALSLILGQRADINLLKDKTKKCVIEAVFQIKGYQLESFFETNELDYNDILIIRREVNVNGVSRAFINDTPVNLILLKEINDKLVDIHSQHQNLLLSNYQFQLKVVDSFAQHQNKLLSYKTLYGANKKLIHEFEQLKLKADKAKLDSDYFSFQFEQLLNAKLQENEQVELENNLQILSHTEEIKENLSKVMLSLSENEDNIISKLKEIQNSLSSIQKYYQPAIDINNRFACILIELKDLVNEINNLNEKLDFNPEQLGIIKERLDVIYHLQQKHKVNSVADLIEKMKMLDSKLNEIQSFETEISKVNEQIRQNYEELNNYALDISKRRQSVIQEIEMKVIKLLNELGMPNASFQIQLKRSDNLNINGMDDITFLFSANKNVDIQDISKVASGGELSRVMLCIKSLIAKSVALPTIIFDEIDTGISGEIGYKMGKIMKKMSHTMQVVSITHLPQIAANGEHHFIVFKDDSNDIAATKIKLLNGEERITEIAKLLSGKKLTEASLRNAKELLEN
jgi:DNA repair protein RecN (Recombination protein N)